MGARGIKWAASSGEAEVVERREFHVLSDVRAAFAREEFGIARKAGDAKLILSTAAYFNCL